MLYHGKYTIPDSTKYVVDYVYNEHIKEWYYQLVRVKDDAILCSAMTCDYISLEAWKRGINYLEVSYI